MTIPRLTTMCQKSIATTPMARKVPKRVGGTAGNVDPPEDDQQIQKQQHHAPGKTPLLGKNRKGEIGVPLGKKGELRLGAFHESLAEQAAAADGDFGLDNVISGAQGILLRVEKGEDALFLVIPAAETIPPPLRRFPAPSAPRGWFRGYRRKRRPYSR